MQYPTVPMHKVSKFGEITRKLARSSWEIGANVARTSQEFTTFPSTLHISLPRNSYEIGTNLVRM